MALEIERKYLIKNNHWKKKAKKGVKILQGYLNFHPKRNVRVRLKGKKAFITVKGKTRNITRKEFEFEIPFSDGKELLGMCKGPIIKKTRYRLNE